MRVKSILNQVEKYKDFVYERVRWKGEGGGRALEVQVRARAHRGGRCSGCGEPGPGYDRLPAREFEYEPLWGIGVYFLYALRRVQCARCGVKVEAVPWGQGKQTLTRSYMQFFDDLGATAFLAEGGEVFSHFLGAGFPFRVLGSGVGLGASGPVGYRSFGH